MSSHVSSDQWNKTPGFGQAFRAPVGREAVPQVAAGIQNLQEFNHNKNPQERYLPIAASATTGKPFLSPYPTPARWLMYFISKPFHILQSNALDQIVFFMPANKFTEMLVYIPDHSQPKDCEKACEYSVSRAWGSFSFFHRKVSVDFRRVWWVGCSWDGVIASMLCVQFSLSTSGPAVKQTQGRFLGFLSVPSSCHHPQQHRLFV